MLQSLETSGSCPRSQGQDQKYQTAPVNNCGQHDDCSYEGDYLRYPFERKCLNAADRKQDRQNQTKPRQNDEIKLISGARWTTGENGPSHEYQEQPSYCHDDEEISPPPSGPFCSLSIHGHFSDGRLSRRDCPLRKQRRNRRLMPSRKGSGSAPERREFGQGGAVGSSLLMLRQPVAGELFCF